MLSHHCFLFSYPPLGPAAPARFYPAWVRKKLISYRGTIIMICYCISASIASQHALHIIDTLLTNTHLIEAFSFCFYLIVSTRWVWGSGRYLCVTDLNVVVLQEWVVLTSAGLHGPRMHLIRTGCYRDYFRVSQTKESSLELLSCSAARLLGCSALHFSTFRLSP